jgi:betaine-aldehyde dehydrogenase
VRRDVFLIFVFFCIRIHIRIRDAWCMRPAVLRVSSSRRWADARPAVINQRPSIMKATAKSYAMLIDGEWVAASSTKQTLTVVNPATGKAIATVPDAGHVEVDRAVTAARRAFAEGPWRDEITAQERGRILFRIAEWVRKEHARLAELETLNSGKPLAEAELDITDVATCFEYYGGLATKLHGEVLNVPDNAMSLVLKEPIGVAAQIIPWNYPLLMAAWKLAPAVCAGCTMVIKPAEQTPLTLLELGRAFEECGLPKGVVSIITGRGETAGAPLVVHPDVDKVAFTGSLDVGRIILRAAADGLKKVTLELGGKSPNIFFADADFENAVEGALFGVFYNQGEVCSAGSRVLVQRSIYDRMLEAMVEKAKSIKLGPGIDRTVKMGPLVSKEQMDRVVRYQGIGKTEAKVALGGGPAIVKGHEDGFFVEPTIFYDVDNSARIAREEIFGPVMAVIPFDKEEDALRIANDSPFGLAAAVWSRDIFRCLRVVKRLEAGVVWVNHMQPTFVEAPWGGYKMSGIGRELGPRGAEEYLQTKQVHINLNEKPIGWY